MVTTTKMLCQYPLSISTRTLVKHCGSGSHIMPSNALNYIYTWKANCQSKSEAKNGGHGAFLDVSFRPLRGHPGCQSQMVSRILIGLWSRKDLKMTSRRPPCRPCLASLFRPMIDGSWPSRFIYSSMIERHRANSLSFYYIVLVIIIII